MSTQTQKSTTSQNQVDRRGRRDELVREYNQQSASRARWARLSAQDTIKSHMQNSARAKARALERAEYENKRKERGEIEARRRAQQRDRAASEARTSAGANESSNSSIMYPKKRVVEPLSSKEYQEKTRRSFEHYERERAVRDPYSRQTQRNSNREVIDGRGTIDSRAFNELDIISNKTINDQDRHETSLSTNDSPKRWKTKDSQTSRHLPSLGNREQSENGVFSFYKQLPPFVQISIPIIIVLIIIVLFLLHR